ncbi:hypothetical protein NF212_03665 [Parasalinivibrio latis]|uniref:hypothetical protein n=1 Tax=Parasalinivibrio latis TaxID=2952610 RepID=UPI0030E0B125
MTKDRFSCLHGTAAVSLIFMLMAAPAQSGQARLCPPSNHWNENIRDMDRIRQATVINQVGVLTSDWYRRVLTSGSPAQDIPVVYPSGMTALDIASADIHQNSNGGIHMCVALNARVDGKAQRLEDAFVFNPGSSAMEITGVERKAPAVTLDTPEQVVATQKDGYTARLVAYLWLSEINRLDVNSNVPKLRMNGGVSQIIARTRNQLGDTGWMLRKVSHQAKNNGQMEVDVSLEWKGIRPDGRYTLAAFRHTLLVDTAGLAQTNTLNILAVNEDILLPNAAPWEKLLC